MIIKNAMVFTEKNEFQVEDIYIQGEKFTGSQPVADDEIDATGLYAIPGLTDIHMHGCMGYDLCDGRHEAIRAITEYQARNGITTLCPATMTLDEGRLEHICETVATYQGENGSVLCALNMEGPFISAEKKGAQNADYIHKPDAEMFRRLQKKSGNMFRLVSIAPETEGADDFISNLKDEVVLSLAHTTADYSIARNAFEKGASHVTHLYNAMPPFSHRDPGVIGAAFDVENSHVELICDGVHIHPSVIRATFKMFGEDRIILVSDSMRATGLADGEYDLGGQTVKVTGNKAILPDGTIAGSVMNLMDCVRNVVRNVGIPLETAVKCATVNPAMAIGIYEHFGSITPGKSANLVLLDENLEIKSVIIKGKQIKIEGGIS